MLLITNNVGWSVPIHLFIIGIQVYTPSLVTLCLVWFGNVWRVDLLTRWQNCLDWRSKFAIWIGKVDEHDVAPGCVTSPHKSDNLIHYSFLQLFTCRLSSHSLGGPVDDFISTMDDNSKPFDTTISYGEQETLLFVFYRYFYQWRSMKCIWLFTGVFLHGGIEMWVITDIYEFQLQLRPITKSLDSTHHQFVFHWV